MLRNGSAAENAAATVMQGKKAHPPKKSRHRMTPGTLKFAAYHVLCLEGSKGLNVLQLAEKIQVLRKFSFFFVVKISSDYFDFSFVTYKRFYLLLFLL